MSNLHLVTGYAGQAHVSAADDGSFNRAIFGSGQYVFDIGSKLAASVVSNNKITIADGDLLMQGRHVRLNEGTTVALTINNGTQGKLRNDLIVARYTKDSVSGVEQVNLVVIQGTAVDSNPADPAYTSGDIINDHALLNDMPLYRVPLNGLTVGTPVALFSLASVHIAEGSITGDKLSDAVNALSLGGIGIDLLWTNESIYSTFAEQTISLDLSDYQMIYVTAQYQPSGSPKGRNVCNITITGEDGLLVYAWGDSGTIASRRFSTDASSIKFYDCYRGSNSTVNNFFTIPQYIYGIKGVK